jgi:hypothetical protein
LNNTNLAKFNTIFIRSRIFFTYILNPHYLFLSYTTGDFDITAKNIFTNK